MARSREFEIDTVLVKAMDLFWRQGYEKTSIQELVTHMGIHRRSLYDTFGDKHALFLEALSRYQSIFEAKIKHRLEQSSSTRQSIRQLFDMSICLEDGLPKGCLLVNTAVELALHDPEAALVVHENFLNTEELFYTLLVNGQESGEISTALDAVSLSQYLNNAWVGLRVMVKATEDKEKLENIIDLTMAILK